MAFYVDFLISNPATVVNENISFISTSTNGTVYPKDVYNSLDVSLDIDTDLIDINDPIFTQAITSNSFNSTTISKYSWKSSDGYFLEGEEFVYEGNDTNRLIHYFRESGLQNITLTIWSDTFSFQGIPFKFKISKTKDITVLSRFYTILTQRFPNWETIKSKPYEDLIVSISAFFERMYKDIKNINSLVDIENINEDFLEYWSATLGHSEEYSRKISGKVSDDKFDEYDIFDKIKNNTATKVEIENFRRFLLFSSELFNKKGSSYSVEKFLEFFSVNGKIEELWTISWGNNTFIEVYESFNGGKWRIENNVDLIWEDVRFIGNDNEKCTIEKTENSLILDSFSNTIKLLYDTDCTLVTGGFAYFNIPFPPQHFINIVKEDGSPIFTEDFSLSDYYDILSVNTSSYELKVKNDNIEIGQRIAVSYSDVHLYNNLAGSFDIIEGEDKSCYIVSKDKNYKNIDIDCIFNFEKQKGDQHNIRTQDKKINIIFRGIKNEIDAYSSFGEFYQVSIDGKNSTCFLSKVAQIEDNASTIIQTLNLGNINNIVHEKVIYDTQNNKVEIDFEKIYEAKITINGNYISAYFRERTDILNKINCVAADIGCDIKNNISIEWVVLFENILLDQRDNEVLSTSYFDRQLAVSYSYKLINDKGHYGISSTNSILKLHYVHILPLDFDETLYNTFEKESQIKPKYLDNIVDNDIKFNNNEYTEREHKVIITKDYNTKTNYKLPDIDSSLINIGFDNIPITSDIGSRYTVTFDEAWIQNNFTSKEDVMDKIIVPFSSFDTPIYIENNVQEKQFYKNILGQTDRFQSYSGFIDCISGQKDYSYTYPFILNTIIPPQITITPEQIVETISISASSITLSGGTYVYEVLLDKPAPDSTYTISLDVDSPYSDASTFISTISGQQFYTYDIGTLSGATSGSPSGSPTLFYPELVQIDRLLETTERGFIVRLTTNKCQGYKINFILYNVQTLDDQYNISLPGSFLYDEVKSLDTVQLSPQYLECKLERVENGKYSYSQKIRHLIMSYGSEFVNEIYEEVCPYSCYFTDLETNDLNAPERLDGETFFNLIGNPIIIDNNRFRSLIGIRFYNTDIIKSIIQRSGRTCPTLWGKFTFNVPLEALKFKPTSKVFENGVKTTSRKFTYMIPIGGLNENILNYSLPTSFMHNQNDEDNFITLNKLFITIPRSNFKIQQDTLEVLSVNPFENYLNNFYCERFIGGELSVSAKLQDYEYFTLNRSSIPYRYILSDNIIKLLSNVNTISTYYNNQNKSHANNIDDISNELSFWEPNSVWRKREFSIMPFNTSNGIVTGLNRSSGQKNFYGNVIDNNSEQTGLQIKLLDGIVNKNIMYYAQLKFNITWSGYNELLLSRDSNGVTIRNNPLSKDEAYNVVVVGTENEKYKDHTESKQDICVKVYMPIYWNSEENSLGILDWGNYIKNSDDINGSVENPSFTLTPFGIYSWLMNHSNEANSSEVESLEYIRKVTSGWTLQDWNERFFDLVTIEMIAEEIPKQYYTLFKDFGIKKDYFSKNPNTYISYKGNIGINVNWEVTDDRIFPPTDINSLNFFRINPDLHQSIAWVGNAKTFLNNYIPTDDIAKVDTTDFIISSKNNNFLNSSTLFGNYLSNIKIDDNKVITIKDDFNSERKLEYVSFIKNIRDIYDFSQRVTTIETTSDSFNTENFYDITIKDSSPCMVMNVEKLTNSIYDPGKSGSDKLTEIGNLYVFDNNGGYPSNAIMLNREDDNFEMSVDVFFDSSLKNIRNYDGRKLEFILKASSSVDPQTNKIILDEYYFVGIGAFSFDVALGVAKYNKDKNILEKSFLSSFGSYNGKSIKLNTWHTFKVKVENEKIKVYLNERNNQERLILSYNISLMTSKKAESYISGNFEELVYTLTQVGKENGITYPQTLGNEVGLEKFREIFNDSLSKSIRPIGNYNGFVLFNDKTYITNVTHSHKENNNVKFSNCFKQISYNIILDEIKQKYNININEIRQIQKTLNGTIYILADNCLYYKMNEKPVEKFSNYVKFIYAYKDKLIVLYQTNIKTVLQIVKEDFSTTYNTFVRDNNFHSDHINNYMEYTERWIARTFFDKKNIYVSFGDIDSIVGSYINDYINDEHFYDEQI